MYLNGPGQKISGSGQAKLEIGPRQRLELNMLKYSSSPKGIS